MRHASLRLIGAAALLAGSVQVSVAQTTNGVPPTDVPAKPAPKIDPKQVADFINALIKPRPKPTPTPAPTPPPSSVPTQIAVTPPIPPPSPSPRPVPAPVSKPAPGVVPHPAPLPLPVADTAPLPAAEPSETAAPAPTFDLASPPPQVDFYEEHTPLPAPFPWAMLVGLVAAAVAAGLTVRRWFWPRLALSCRIDSGAPRLIALAQPLVNAPELQILVEIELGSPSTPLSLTVS